MIRIFMRVYLICFWAYIALLSIYGIAYIPTTFFLLYSVEMIKLIIRAEQWKQ